MQNLLEVMKAETQQLNNVKHQLEQYADSARMLGNDTLANRLALLAFDVDNAKISIQDAVSEALDEALKLQQQALVNTIGAAMAAAERKGS